jgi:hypothetical protein
VIRKYLLERFAEIAEVAKDVDVHVGGAEMDAAMRKEFQWWEAGMAARLFKI